MAESTTKEQRCKIVTGLFRDRESAEQAYSSLTDRGYTKLEFEIRFTLPR